MNKLVAAFVGLSEGIVVGSAIVAFITLLDIVPRLAQLTGTEESMKIYESVIIFACSFVSMAGFYGATLHLGKTVTAFIGLFMGIFVGLLASALTEVTNVIPVIVNRLKIHAYVKFIFFALLGGKVVGSLIYWMVINK